MPLVSVIVPNYNHAKYLPQRLESIFSQTIKDYELILMDDCSQDNSLEILYRYSDHPQVSYLIVNNKNSGNTYIQWLRGINLATGQYIWIAESDDRTDALFLETCLKILQGDDKIGLVYTQSMIIDEDDNIAAQNLCYPHNISDTRWKHNFRSNGRKEIADYLFYKNTIPNVSAVLFSRKHLLIPDKITEFKYSGDWLLYCNILMASDIAYVNAPLNYYRNHPATVRNKYFSNGTKEYEYLQLLDFLSTNGLVNKNKIRERILNTIMQWWKKKMNISPKVHLLLLRSVAKTSVKSLKKGVKSAADSNHISQ
jgi:glycosyltransferase involved in cell wall biosynthesis